MYAFETSYFEILFTREIESFQPQLRVVVPEFKFDEGSPQISILVERFQNFNTEMVGSDRAVVVRETSPAPATL